jgi:hypothetical protein
MGRCKYQCPTLGYGPLVSVICKAFPQASYRQLNKSRTHWFSSGLTAHRRICRDHHRQDFVVEVLEIELRDLVIGDKM